MHNLVHAFAPPPNTYLLLLHLRLGLGLGHFLLHEGRSANGPARVHPGAYVPRTLGQINLIPDRNLVRSGGRLLRPFLLLRGSHGRYSTTGGGGNVGRCHYLPRQRSGMGGILLQRSQSAAEERRNLLPRVSNLGSYRLPLCLSLLVVILLGVERLPSSDALPNLEGNVEDGIVEVQTGGPIQINIEIITVANVGTGTGEQIGT
mmetsp:Transcript_1389/g.2529  ORF Transcript_1389/g.2529 Transcript_1389/m.2529 type:complete len:204 (+) Transcript_1389:283-894(+)